MDAHFKLSNMYELGQGIEEDKGKMLYHAEVAAIGGHPRARCILGYYEWMNENYMRAVKHLMIAAKQGEDESIKILMDAFKVGFLEKEDLAGVGLSLFVVQNEV